MLVLKFQNLNKEGSEPIRLKTKLKRSLLHLWQQRWDQSEKGRYYPLLAKVSTDFQTTTRELALLLSNHGPFQLYLYKINKSPSPFCICGKYSDSLHYVLDSPLTSHFHVRRDPNIPISHWLSFIKNPNSIQRIKNCMTYLENNDHVLQNPNPPQAYSDSSDSE